MTIKERHHVLLSAIQIIASGKGTGAKPMCGENARQIAKATLVALGERWPKQTQYFRVERVNGEAKLLPMGGERHDAA